MATDIGAVRENTQGIEMSYYSKPRGKKRPEHVEKWWEMSEASVWASLSSVFYRMTTGVCASLPKKGKCEVLLYKISIFWKSEISNSFIRIINIQQ